MALPSTGQTVYIVYSNSTSFWGQLAYGLRRVSASAAGTPCAALELTHGGLGADERPEWIQAKQRIPVEVKQLHYDELPNDVGITPCEKDILALGSDN
jgi:hypothetical protein